MEPHWTGTHPPIGPIPRIWNLIGQGTLPIQWCLHLVAITGDLLRHIHFRTYRSPPNLQCYHLVAIPTRMLSSFNLFYILSKDTFTKGEFYGLTDKTPKGV